MAKINFLLLFIFSNNLNIIWQGKKKTDLMESNFILLACKILYMLLTRHHFLKMGNTQVLFKTTPCDHAKPDQYWCAPLSKKKSLIKTHLLVYHNIIISTSNFTVFIHTFHNTWHSKWTYGIRTLLNVFIFYLEQKWGLRANNLFCFTHFTIISAF